MPAEQRATRSVDVYLLDPDPTQRRLISTELRSLAGPRFVPQVCETPDEALALAGQGRDHVMIADLDALGGVERLAALTGTAGPVIATSAQGSVTVAIEAMRAGAFDFVTKPVGAKGLLERLDKALAAWRAVPAEPRGRADARPMAAAATTAPADDAFSGFIGGTEEMRRIFGQIRRIAPSRAPAFITGESGTGKELCAEAIHRLSGGRTFVAINCSAIPKDLIESEIFGHVRGAFTGAVDNRTGAAELADGGTLFLDEICEMDLALQAKLLRFVQTGMIQRVGDAEARRIDVRLVSATNRDPRAEVAAGRFRADLYYRLAVLPIELPPLRERRDDILPLARSFLDRFAADEGRAGMRLTPAAEDRLLAYRWPGNVRQLENTMRRIAVLHEGGTVDAADLPDAMMPDFDGEPMAAAPSVIVPFWVEEKRIIEAAIAACEGNIARAAAALGLSASTIYRKRQAWAEGRTG